MFHYPNGFPATETDPAIDGGWFFEHRATGELIGPYADKLTCQHFENEHHNEPFAMPKWALEQS